MTEYANALNRIISRFIVILLSMEQCIQPPVIRFNSFNLPGLKKLYHVSSNTTTKRVMNTET